MKQNKLKKKRRYPSLTWSARIPLIYSFCFSLKDTKRFIRQNIAVTYPLIQNIALYPFPMLALSASLIQLKERPMRVSIQPKITTL